MKEIWKQLLHVATLPTSLCNVAFRVVLFGLFYVSMMVQFIHTIHSRYQSLVTQVLTPITANKVDCVVASAL